MKDPVAAEQPRRSNSVTRCVTSRLRFGHLLAVVLFVGGLLSLAATTPVDRIQRSGGKVQVGTDGGVTITNPAAAVTRFTRSVVFDGIAAPSVAPAGKGKFYFDSGSKQFLFSMDGSAYAPVGTTINATDGAIPYRSSSTAFSDSPLRRVDANTIAQRNGTSSQLLRIYRSYTDDSNYERMRIGHRSDFNQFVWEQEVAGTGISRDMAIRTGGAAALILSPGGTLHLGGTTQRVYGPIVFNTDNANDIGEAGVTRPRTGHFGTSLIAPLFRSDSAKVLVQGTGTGATQLATTQTTPPTCSSNCGNSPSVAGTDTFMRVTMGSSGSPASGWVVTFNGTWAAAPVCTVQMAKAGMVVGKMALTVVTTTTTITVVTNGTAPATTDVYAITCGGIQ